VGFSYFAAVQKASDLLDQAFHDGYCVAIYSLKTGRGSETAFGGLMPAYIKNADMAGRKSENWAGKM
jgi:hypothetical protein